MKKHSLAKMRGPLKALISNDYPMVKWVVDAEKSLMFKTNTRDIKKANPASFTDCVAAKCVKRNMPGRAVIVSRSVALVIDGVTAVRYKINSKSALRRKIIEDADLRRQGVVGETFTLSAPWPYNRLGQRHQSGRTGKIGEGVKAKPFKATKARIVEEAPGTVVSFASGLRAV